MRNVYIVRYEGLTAFSTARKSIEYAKEITDNEWYIDIAYPSVNSTLAHNPLHKVPTERMISVLNDRSYLQITRGAETINIEKCEVR